MSQSAKAKTLSKTCDTDRRVCQSHPDLCCVEEVIEISERMTSPCGMRDLCPPSPCEVPHLGFTDWLHCPPPKKLPPLSGRWRGMFPKLRFKEAKSAFMGNYANLCSGIGVETLSPKTVAKLPSLIGNRFQVGFLSPLISNSDR